MSSPVAVTIRLVDEIAHSVSYRDVLRDLSEARLKAAPAGLTDLHYDFTGVTFVSRSAAHELLMIQEELRAKRVNVDFLNTQGDVTTMIRIVAANRALPLPRVEVKTTHVSAESVFG